MRVLLISHTCQSRSAGQPKAAQLAKFADLELRVLVPDRWQEYGQWQRAQRPQNHEFQLCVGKAMWPWAGPAQWYLHWYPRLARLLRHFQPDIIDLWEEPWSLVSAQTCWLRDRFAPHAKLIIETEQNIDKTLPPPFEQFRSYSLRHAAFAIGRNREALQVLAGKGYDGPSQVVPNAVDAQLFRPLPREECRAQLLREIGLRRNPAFVAGYVGRLVEEKGLKDAVDALKFCTPDVHLIFAGSGDFRDALQQHAQRSGVLTQIHFLPARAFEKLPVLMNALDVFLLPSRTTPSWKEQFGRVIIEAHACRTPVIGSDSGAIPEVIAEGGLTFPEGDAGALGAAMEALKNDEPRRLEMGLAGRAQVEKFYTWERVAQQMRHIYRQVLADGNS